MKKILILFTFISLTIALKAQFNGDGSSANPFNGTFQGDLQWNSTNFPSHKVYINGDVTIDNELLTIEAGMDIIFTSAGADLIVTGTGYLVASGSSTNNITFTADFSPFNGIFGEAGERWGHIVFNNPDGSNQSRLEYCIVEYGDVSSGSNTTSYGGGIYSNVYSNLVLANCTIRLNKATHGAGIMALSGASPTLTNCLISNNTATISGGGIYLHTNSASLITNCIVVNNSSGNGGGGGIFLDACNNVRTFNSIFVQNTTSRADGGYNIQYYNVSSPTNRPQFINCIVWGNDNSISHISYVQQSTDFVNCGIQDVSTPASSYTNCIDLSGTNGDATGPNFINPSGGDYSIAFISPCRDAGTTPSPAVPTDFIGNPRVGPYDIGAYEVQAPRWAGTIDGDWFTAGNWSINIVPPDGSYVIIAPSLNNPSINTNDVTLADLVIQAGSSLTVSSLKILTATTVSNSGSLNINYSSVFNASSFTNGGTFTLNPRAWATTTNVVNNGTINLISDNIDMFSYKFDTYSGTGVSNIAMFLSGGGGPGTYNWHYVAVPVFYNKDKTVFTSIDSLNLMKYDDKYIPDTPTATDNDGWIWHDGYVTGPPPSMGGPSFYNLFTKVGYAFWHSTSTSSIVNFSNISPLLSNLGSVPLQYSGTGKTYYTNYGYNLLGNSLTCGLNWNLVTPSGAVSNVIYYTINYKIGSYVRGGPGINGATQHIPALQGFLVRANASGASLDFTNARENTSQPRYKRSLDVNNIDSKGDGSSDPIIKLELDNPGNQDETAIWFNQNATKSFDASYDGLKILSSGYDQIYSWSGTQKYGINAMPLPTDADIIPIAVKFLTGGSGIKIVASQLVGLDNYNVTLTDKANSNFTVDLKSTNSYTFSSDAGTFPDRFVLTVGTITTAVPDVIIPNKAFNVYTFDKTLNIDLLNDEWDGKTGDVNIFDLTGRKILQRTNIEWYKGTLTKIPLDVQQGIYIVEIKAENKKFITKINIIK